MRVEKTTELILPTDQRLHADQTVEIAIQKPNRPRVNFLNLSGDRQLFYDGTTFSLGKRSENQVPERRASGPAGESRPVTTGGVHHVFFILDVFYGRRLLP